MKVEYSTLTTFKIEGKTTPTDDPNYFIFKDTFDAVGFAYDPEYKKMCAICTDEQGKLHTFPINNLIVKEES